MKRWIPVTVIALSVAAACGGKVVAEPEEEASGQGGTSSSSFATSSSSTSSVASSSDAVSATATGSGPSPAGQSSSNGTGAGAGGPCVSCGEYVGGDPYVPDPGQICAYNGPPSSLDIFFNLVKCICDFCPPCHDNFCIDVGNMTQACSQCLGDELGAGACELELNACFSDAG
jgi:hypothetical protein